MRENISLKCASRNSYLILFFGCVPAKSYLPITAESLSRATPSASSKPGRTDRDPTPRKNKKCRLYRSQHMPGKSGLNTPRNIYCRSSLRRLVCSNVSSARPRSVARWGYRIRLLQPGELGLNNKSTQRETRLGAHQQHRAGARKVSWLEIHGYRKSWGQSGGALYGRKGCTQKASNSSGADHRSQRHDL